MKDKLYFDWTKSEVNSLKDIKDKDLAAICLALANLRWLNPWPGTPTPWYTSTHNRLIKLFLKRKILIQGNGKSKLSWSMNEKYIKQLLGIK